MTASCVRGSVYEVGRHDGDVFIVMQYVQGPNLRSRMRAPGRTLHERLAVRTAG